MAIRPVCDNCNVELTDFGALLFSPPDEDASVIKFHLCSDCYEKIVSKFGAKKKS